MMDAPMIASPVLASATYPLIGVADACVNDMAKTNAIVVF
jgi:hypothetical protein